MFYDAVVNDHGMRYDPFKALIVPRPIGWISTISPEGRVNLAPYSFFNAVADKPHYVMFSSAGRKDTLRNVEATGEFVCNLVSFELRDAMNATASAVDSSVDEFEFAGLEKQPSRLVAPPRVEDCAAAFECRYTTTVELPGHDLSDGGYAIVIGQVVGIYIDDVHIEDGRVNTASMRAMARLGYSEYAVVDQTVRMARPR